jgi:putative FmdB family regulatory protein
VVVTRFSAPNQLQVAGEDHAAASGRHLDEILVRYRREVFYVASQEAQPCAQFSQHDIGDESGLHENPATLLGMDVSIDAQYIYTPYTKRNFRSDPFRREGGGPMPTYSYKCRKCDHRFQEILSFKEYEEGKRKCPKCRSRSVEQILEIFFAKTSRKS